MVAEETHAERRTWSFGIDPVQKAGLYVLFLLKLLFFSFFFSLDPAALESDTWYLFDILVMRKVFATLFHSNMVEQHWK